MNWFLNLSTRAKLFWGFGLMVVFLVIVIILAYFSLDKVNASQKELYDRDLTIVENLLELRSGINRTRTLTLEMMMITNRSAQDKLISEVESITARNDSAIVRVNEYGQNDQQMHSKFEELISTLKDYRQKREEQFSLIQQGDVNKAKQLSVGAQTDRYEKIRAICVELSEQAKLHARNTMVQNESAINGTIRIFGIIGMIAFLLGIVLTLFLNRLIASPLQEISLYSNRIASGDLMLDMKSNNRRDEVGQLLQSFEKMIKSLKEMANVAQRIAASDLTVSVNPQTENDILGKAFLKMVENLRRIAKELSEGINVLSTSASEILTATTQVASSASETATAVSETSTTVEEVKQTSQVATQKAKYVSDISQKAAQISVAGKKSVDDSINGMNKIREQMESIGESTIKLSEQSQAIGEIIASVNDLADQSNLLAVNAAIEAAKAGEQGKGFTVVAQEIKSLAEQSKQATAQVRSILSDVQKAMSAAVLATEQGMKAVESGVKQTTEAGSSIKVLSDSIMEASQAATQIAASSQQQSVGMDQVALAMENIKQASTQNVIGTKQAETAAQNLHGLGQKLKELVEQYKV